MFDRQLDIYKYARFQDLPPDSWQRDVHQQGRRFCIGIDQAAIDKMASKSSYIKAIGRVSLVHGDTGIEKIDRDDENSYTHLSIPA